MRRRNAARRTARWRARTRSALGPWSWTDGDASSQELSAHGGRVDTLGLPDGGEGVARQVPTRGTSDVCLAHLPPVHATLNAALFEVRGDGPMVNAEGVGETWERPAVSVTGDESVYFAAVQSALDRLSARV